MKLLKKLFQIFQKVSPSVRKRLVGIFIVLAFLNGFVWIYTLIISQHYPVFLSLITLAYGLGLRHAVDADHIAAIDNTTRKLMQEGKKPVAVGFFFSLGHSTIVVILALLIVISTSFVTKDLPELRNVGVVIGTLISSIFLLTIGIINFFIFIDVFKMWRKIISGEMISSNDHGNKGGVVFRILSPFLKTVSSSWHMYVIGFLFGLGFDTASEVALLSISFATTTSGIPLFSIVLLPLAFAAGMSLVDTIDGILMLGAYGWAYIKPIRKVYYNMHITFISVCIALFVGSIEAMQVIFSQLKLHGFFIDFVGKIDFGNLGYIIISVFILSWIFSIGLYRFKKYDKLG